MPRKDAKLKFISFKDVEAVGKQRHGVKSKKPFYAMGINYFYGHF